MAAIPKPGIMSRLRGLALGFCLALPGLPASGQTAISLDQLQRIALLGDPKLDALVRKDWGNISGGTPEEKLADVRRFNNDLRAFPGDASGGHEIFKKTCAVCHRLFGEGGQIGPDLTGANRKDRDYLLVNIVDPSAVIRNDYVAYVAITTNGRLLNGLIVEATPKTVTLVDAKNEHERIGAR